MSRTRIVRGKITEIVGGDLTYFSESSISEYAADVCLQKKVYFFLESVFDFLKVDKKVISVKFLEL